LVYNVYLNFWRGSILQGFQFFSIFFDTFLPVNCGNLMCLVMLYLIGILNY